MALVSDIIESVAEATLRDHTVPYLYDRASLLKYLNEGVAIFARKTHWFTEVVNVPYLEDATHAELPAGTVFVRAVSDEDGCPLDHQTNRQRYRAYGARPAIFKVDTKYRNIRVRPKPARDIVLEVDRAYRPAKLELTDELELDEDYVLLIEHFIAYRALETNDPDGSDTIAAKPFKEYWEEGLVSAKSDVISYNTGNNNRVTYRSWT